MASKTRLHMRLGMTWGVCPLLLLAGSICVSLALAVEEVQPPLYYLEDAHGELRPAPGLTLEDFRRAYDEMHGLGPEARTPSYVLQKVTLAGTAEKHFARLTVHCDLLLEREGTIRVPLSLAQAVIAGQPEYNGDTPPVLAFDEPSGGYVGWIKGKPGQRRRLTLKVLVPLATVGGKTVLRLRIPSGTESELTFTAPMARAVAEASEGTVLTVSPSDDKTATRWTVGGPRGDFELAWHEPDVRPSTAPAVLEAAGEILARIDNQGIQSQATLVVRGHGKPFDRFRVRLPVGSQWVPTTGSTYTMAEAPADESARAGGPWIEVRLREKTMGPVHVRVAARRALDTSLFGQWIELAGFTVLGAARQSGYLAVEVADDLDLVWDPQLGIQQSENLPEALACEDLIAGFKYFTQPCSLRARVAPRQTRISVEPDYVATVDADQVRLEATLRYTVRGKKAHVLDVELGDWEYDEIGPDNVVAADRVVHGNSGSLSIPLCQPSTGKIELTLKAHRRREAGDDLLRLTFPRPQATTPAVATMRIVPEDRVQMTVDAKATVGLARQQMAPGPAAGGHQQPPVLYRGDPAGAVFVAQCRVHARQIAVSSTTTVMLDRPVPQVRQTFSYKIDYEPLDTLLLELPRALRDSANLEFRLAGRRVPATDISPDAPAGASGEQGPTRVRLALGTPRIGACDLEVRFPLDPPTLVPRSCIQATIPLVVPLDGDLTGNRLLVATRPELQVSLVEGPWVRQNDATAPPMPAAETGRPSVEFVADGRAREAQLGLSLEARETARATIVARALVQTWLTQHARQDRAVFRFTSHEPSLYIIVPQGTDLAKVDAFLDGKPVEARPAGGRTLRIDVPETTATGQRLLEVLCQSTAPQVLRGRRTLELPRLREGVWVRRMYWQLTLPKNEHVVNAPSGLVREFRWGWNGLFWGRQPLLQTRDLEDWVGVSEDPSRSAGDDSDLFSTFGSPGPVDLVIVSRSWIVLGVSGAALVVGLLLIYVPASRHPAGLFVAAVALGCAALVYPEPTLLALQAASLGLALSLLAGLLDRSVARRRRGLVTLEVPGSAIEKESTQTQFRAVSAAAGDTTDALPRNDPSSHRTARIEP